MKSTVISTVEHVQLQIDLMAPVQPPVCMQTHHHPRLGCVVCKLQELKRRVVEQEEQLMQTPK